MWLLIAPQFMEAACSGSASPWTATTWADVQDCHDNHAGNGDTINISGSVSATSLVTLTKYVRLVGNGGGKVQGSSTTSLLIGTGSKSFTVQSGSVIQAWTAGETLRARYKAKSTEYMEGTVTSWNGTTLVLNVTTTGGSGTYAAWTFETAASTVITNNNGSSGILSITDSSAGNTEISNLEFKSGTGLSLMVIIDPGANGKPIIVHDLRCSMDYGTGVCFYHHVNRGVYYRTYVDCFFNWANFVNQECTNVVGWKAKFGGSSDSSWTTVSSLGSADTNGDNNIYIEDSFVTGVNQSFTDWDDNARGVMRHMTWDNSSAGAHGVDTSNWGVRHVDIYANLMIFNDLGNDTGNLQAWYFQRGGTILIHGNTMPDINSSAKGNKSEVVLFLEELHRNAGPYACWGMDIVGNQYPAPRQIGYGYVTGSGNTDPTYGYQGDSEPTYIWSNGSIVVSVQDGQPFNCSGATDDAANYVVSGRDYFYSSDASNAKGGYSTFTYPHPLNTTSPIVLITPSSGAQASSGSLTVTGNGTAWVNGTTVASLGTGVTVNSTTCSNSTSCTISITIASDAIVGGRTLTMTTNSTVDTLTNGFTVTALVTPPVNVVGPRILIRAH